MADHKHSRKKGSKVVFKSKKKSKPFSIFALIRRLKDLRKKRQKALTMIDE